MKVSGFNFLKNGEQLGYPFVEAIRSILPLCDEFVVAVGKSTDRTKEILEEMNEPKLKIVETEWNENVQKQGFVYGQQKMIAQYHCLGDWAFYLEGDEIVHEKDLPIIQQAMEKYKEDEEVEALIFDYVHFYGNTNTISVCPHWIRTGPRLIKTTVRNFAPDGFFWTVLDKNNKRGRYPKVAHSKAKIYHYGQARPMELFTEKIKQVEKYWGKGNLDCWGKNPEAYHYGDVDSYFLRPFEGSHPKEMESFYPKAKGLFQANPNYQLNRKDYGYRIRYWYEQKFGKDTSRKHYKLVR